MGRSSTRRGLERAGTSATTPASDPAASFTPMRGQSKVGRWWRLATLRDVRREVAEIHHTVMTMNHAVVQLEALFARLYHEVHAGSDEALPLFQGYAERLRSDAETSLSAAEVIGRHLAELESLVERVERAAGGSTST